MTTPKLLSLEDIIDKSELLHASQFPDEVFHLLGKSLTEWLDHFLSERDCRDQPVVKGQVDEGAILRGAVFIDEGAVVEPTAFIQGPCYIGPGSQVRHGAYIRGSVYVGKNCVVGHATEVKGSCFFDGAKAGHFAYVGDSILGRMVNLGAGTKLANLKFKNNEVQYIDPMTGKKVASGLRKFGALLADDAQTGCNSVLSPGTILMQKSIVAGCVHFHGTLKTGIAR